MSKKENHIKEQYDYDEEYTEDISDRSYNKKNNKCECHEHQDCEKQTETETQKQKHTHEFLGSTKLAELDEDPHNHRFAGVTGEAIRCGKSHYHRLVTNTDFIDHFHVVCDRTGPAISVGNRKHVHLITGKTSENDEHRHCYIFTTLIQNPIGE